MTARTIKEIEKENEDIMSHNPSGDPHQLQMKRLSSNATESMVVVHGEIASLKKITKDYSESSKKFSKSSRYLSLTAIIIALIALIASLIIGMNANKSDKAWQSQQIELLKDVDKKLSR